MDISNKELLELGFKPISLYEWLKFGYHKNGLVYVNSGQFGFIPDLDGLIERGVDQSIIEEYYEEGSIFLDDRDDVGYVIDTVEKLNLLHKALTGMDINQQL